MPEDEQNAWTLTEHLPQLDDLRIYIITYSLNQSRPTFMPLTKPFILESKKLKRLIVSFATNSCVTHRSDIVCLNNTRLQSKGACPTTIYLNNEVIVQSKFFMPAFGGLVQVKPTSQLTRNLYLDPFLFWWKIIVYLNYFENTIYNIRQFYSFIAKTVTLISISINLFEVKKNVPLVKSNIISSKKFSFRQK